MNDGKKLQGGVKMSGSIMGLGCVVFVATMVAGCSLSSLEQQSPHVATEISDTAKCECPSSHSGNAFDFLRGPNLDGLNPRPFSSGECVVFLGDSITHHGRYMRFISDYYYTRWPTNAYRFVSAGVGGDTSSGCLGRLKEDVFDKDPTSVVVMFGMNDVDLGAYNPGQPVQRQGAAIDAFKRNFPNLIKCLQRGCPCARLTLVTPSPYDEMVLINGVASTSVGLNGRGLTALAEIVREAAESNVFGLVDFHAPMTEYNRKRQRKDATFTLCGSDRVHPDVVGGMFMACQFLKAQGVPNLVSEICLDAEKGVVLASQNAEIREVVREKGVVSFKAKELALPFPIPGETADVARDCGANDFNREMLIATGLASGTYRLLADGIEIGKFSSADLAKGVNLSILPLAPGIRQARLIAAVNLRRCSLESDKLRTMACVRWFLRGNHVDPDDPSAVRLFYETTVVPLAKKGYYEQKLTDYLFDWPNREAILAQIRDCEREIERCRQPRWVDWAIVPLDGKCND